MASLMKALLELGTSKTANDLLTRDEVELLASDREVVLDEEPTEAAPVDDPDSLESRPPVVAVLGHVDHGKTTLLDALRRTQVAASEAGGITQHIGAHAVEVQGRRVTFLDTPGHEAFATLRERGASVADLVVLVVAADDGVRPQTVESIKAAREAGVPVVVALNKVDLPGIDPERVLGELAKEGLNPEEWGGDTQVARVSAKTEMGLEALVERILLVADAELELRANRDALASGVVIESRLDRGRGPLATVLVKRGTLRKGDALAAGTAFGRVRTLAASTGPVSEARPGEAVELVGLSEPPVPGAPFVVAASPKEARLLVTETAKVERTRPVFGDAIKIELKLLVKADAHGSLEAVLESLQKLTHPELDLVVVSSGVGPLGEADVALSEASGARAICFGVTASDEAKKLARGKVPIESYRLIHELTAAIEARLVELLPAVEVEDTLGQATVIATFQSSKVGTIAGCRVDSGVVQASGRVRVIRNGEQLADAAIDSLQREQQAAPEVAAGLECGLHLAGFDRVAIGDTLEVYARRLVKRRSLAEPRPE